MRLLRVPEVAHRLGLEPSTVRKVILRQEIPVVRPSRRAVRVRQEDVEALIRVGYRAVRRTDATPATVHPALLETDKTS